MKRYIFCVVFLLLIVFNVIGYCFLFVIEQQRALHMSSIIEENANEISGNMIFRFPMDFPNAEAARNFRPVEGEITYEGELYHLVKQKLYQDTLYVVCIKDSGTKEARQAIHDYAESFTDHPNTSNTTSGLKLFSALSQDYIATHIQIEHDKSGWTRPIGLTRPDHLYSFTPVSIILQPPQVNS